MKGALFLDRDGTIIVHRPYLHQPEEVEILPGAAKAIRRALTADVRLFLFTNQSGIGRGLFSFSDVEIVHRRMFQLLNLPGRFDGICVAPEQPSEPSRYRKPSPRYILEQLSEFDLDPDHCWMIGDTVSDWQAALSAGIHACAVRSDLTTPDSEILRQSLEVPIFDTLADAMDLVLEDSKSQ